MAKKKPTKEQLKAMKTNPIDLSIKTHSAELEKEKQNFESSKAFAKIELINIKMISELKLDNDEYMHNRITYSRTKLLELASNIAELSKSNSGILGTGLLNPIMLRRNKGRLERIHGDNRIKALIENKQEVVPSIILENVSDELARFMRSSENLNREDLNPYDETLSIIEHIQLACKFESIDKVKSFINKIKNYKQSKTTLTDEEMNKFNEVSDVFDRIGRFNVITFVDRLKLLTVHESIKQALVDGEISYSKAIIINRLKNSDDVLKTLRLAKSSGMSDKQLKSHVLEILSEKEPSSIIKTVNKFDLLKKNYSKISKAKYNKLSVEQRKEVDKIIEEMTGLYSSISSYFN